MLTYLFRVSFLTTLDIYKAYFKSLHNRDTKTKSLIFSVRSYCVCTPQGFVTKCFIIFIVDEVKNFATNNNHSSCQNQSRIEICAKELITDWRFVQQRKEGYYKTKSNCVFERRFNCRLVFQDRLGSDKILYTSNRLIFYKWILGSSDFKFTR